MIIDYKFFVSITIVFVVESTILTAIADNDRLIFPLGDR